VALQDRLAPGLRLVVVGLAVGECAAARGHHHAGAGDAFWRLLYESGLTPRLLAPQEDAHLPDHGVGLTDLAEDTGRPDDGRLAYDVAAFAAKVEHYAPRWVAFHGKAAAEVCARAAGHRPPGLGPTPWTVAGRPAFVLPSASGANRRAEYDGRPTRLEWWMDLAALVEHAP
jgi:TDG/mug DNA glycosylase family protein